ncbi:MAG: site-specific integrase, partial [Bacteroidia bacterium]|nr:site-specific integrase [Bacteroidia bacterium]
MEKFNEYCIIKGYSSKSVERFIPVVNRFDQWKEQQNIEQENITYNDVMAYVNHCRHKGHTASTIKGTVYCLKIYFRFLESEELLDDN